MASLLPLAALPSLPPRSFLVSGATDGIGLESAKQLARQGHTVLLHGRSQPKLRAALEAVERCGGRGVCYEADFGSLRQIREMGEAVRRDFPVLDGLLVRFSGWAVAPLVVFPSVQAVTRLATRWTTPPLLCCARTASALHA